MQETVPCQEKRIPIFFHPPLLQALLQRLREAVEYVYLKSFTELSAIDPPQLELQRELADEPFFLRQTEEAAVGEFLQVSFERRDILIVVSSRVGKRRSPDSQEIGSSVLGILVNEAFPPRSSCCRIGASQSEAGFF